MAKNLGAKIPKNDKLVICDRNSDAASSFVQEAGAGGGEIEVVKTPRKVAEQAVSKPPNSFLGFQSPDEHVLSMI